MKLRLFIVALVILVSATVFNAQTGGNTRGFGLSHIGYGKVLFTKGRAPFATFNLLNESVGCVQATREAIRNDKAECIVRSKAVYKLRDVAQKGGKYYLLIENEAPSGNTGCNACGRCGADGSTGLIWVAIGANKKVIKKSSVPLWDCNTFASVIKEDGSDGEEKLSFRNGLLEFRTEINTYDDEGGKMLTNWRYSQAEPEKGIVAVRKVRSKE
jgi:hypothetical protein